MNQAARGAHLLGERQGGGSGLLARLAAGGFGRIVDRIDAGLDHGHLFAVLPDGSERLLGDRADGPEAEIELKSWNALVRLATGGSAGWYEAWAAGEWSSPRPQDLFALFMRNAATLGGVARAKGPWRWLLRRVHAMRRNSQAQAKRNVTAHYDLGNDFYAAWLGETMTYSSALWLPSDGPNMAAQFATELDLGQIGKCTAIMDRLDLGEGARVLEIGCGWGTLAAMMAEVAQSRVDAISLSDEQLAYAGERYGANGKAQYLHRDYRDMAGQYDAIVSVEMVEAVGREYWPAWFDCIARCLKPGGRAAIQFISIRDELFDAYAASADFIQTYIFPGGMLIRESEFRRLAAERGLDWRDQVDFGAHYAKTLRLWRENFDAAVEGGGLPAGFDRRFVDLWRYYLMYCEGGFRGGGIDVSQVTLVKP